MAERKQNPKNVYYEYFAMRYELGYGLPYQNKTADFVQLAKLFKGLGTKLTVEVWKRGVDNYFRSELGMHTLADLACRFVPFWRGAIDRFGKPLRQTTQTTQVGGERPNGNGASWHAPFLSACFAIAQSRKECRDSIFALVERADELSETDAYAEIERIKATRNDVSETSQA